MEEKKRCGASNNSVVCSKGEYLIEVLREGFNIQKSLPYAIWGAIYIDTKSFDNALQPYMPSGVTVVVTYVEGKIIFTYTEGDQSDRITVKGNIDGLLSYSEMVASLNTNYLRSELMYFSNNTQVSVLPDLTQQNNKILQNEPLYLQGIGGMGSKDNEMINPLSRRTHNSIVPDITEIYLRHQEIKPHTVWVHKFAYVDQGGAFESLQFSFLVLFNEIVNMNKKALT